VFPKSASFQAAASFEKTSQLRTDSIKGVKRNWNMCHLGFSPNLERSWVILLFWPIGSYNLVRELILILLRRQICFQLSLKTALPCYFHVATALVWLNQVSHVRIQNVIYNAIIECFLRLQLNWGQMFRFMRNSVQSKISAAQFNF
jgi:hypothetical protein